MTSQSMGIVDNVADAITRLRYLETKTADDAAMIKLLQSQKDALAQELADIKHNTGIDVFAAEQARDEALRQVAEVRKVITAIGNLALSGARELAGDRLERGTAHPLKAPDKRLPDVSPTTPLPSKPSPVDLDRARTHLR